MTYWQYLRLSWKLNRILDRLVRIEQKEDEMANELADLTTQVQANADTEASAVLLIQGIAQKLADAIASGNPAALTALQGQLKNSADALAAAVVANTPAA